MWTAPARAGANGLQRARHANVGAFPAVLPRVLDDRDESGVETYQPADRRPSGLTWPGMAISGIYV